MGDCGTTAAASSWEEEEEEEEEEETAYTDSSGALRELRPSLQR